MQTPVAGIAARASWSKGRRALLAMACALVAATTPVAAWAQKMGDPVPTPAQPSAIALPTTPAGASDQTEQWELFIRKERTIRNVTAPTLTPFLPDPGTATGAAVIVAPGGGFTQLMIDSEGFDVARWLANHGIAAFVLKYRVRETPKGDNALVIGLRQQAAMRAAAAGGPPVIARPVTIDVPAPSLADAEAAMQMVRARAGEWHVDPAKVGFVGFSAGAMLTMRIGLVEDAALRPDFIAAIYGNQAARAVPAYAPPLFLAIALDDTTILHGPNPDLGLMQSWHAAGKSVEAHFYSTGMHGFGMRGQFASSALWIDSFQAWLKDRRVIPRN